MNIYKYLEETQKHISKNSKYPISKESIFINLLNRIALLTSGLNEPQIIFRPISNVFGDSDYYSHTNELHVSYKLHNGGMYQYNNAIFKDFKLIRIEGDALNSIRKIYNLIELLDIETINNYTQIIYTVHYVHKTLLYDKKRRLESYNPWLVEDINKLNNDTLEKIKKLEEIHNSLIFDHKVQEIPKILNDLIPIWEIDNFKVDEGTTHWYSTYSECFVEGSFSNLDVPIFSSKASNKIIIFPDGSRGSLCSNFLAVKNFNSISNLNEGDTIKLKFSDKGAQIKKYTYLETNYEGFIAVRDNKTNKIEFLADIEDIENSYDDLYDCNKKIYNNWLNQKVTYVK